MDRSGEWRLKKMAIIVGAVALLMLQGCGERTWTEAGGSGFSSHAAAFSKSAATMGPAASTELFKEIDSVPSLEVTAGSETVMAQKGSYCWTDLEKGVGQCADAPMPPSIADVKSKPQVKAGDAVMLDWSGDPPDEMHVTVSFPGEERPDEAMESAGSTIRIPAGEGDRLFVITATWRGGTVPYYFGVSASEDEEAKALRKLAWEAVQANGQAATVIDWKQGEVAEFEAANVSLLALNSEFKKTDSLKGRKLLSVTFRTNNDAMLGPIVAVFDQETRDLVGWQIRE